MNQIFSLSNYFLNPYTVAHLIVAHLFLLLGIFVFWQDKKSANNISYFFICLGGFLWLLIDAIDMSCTNETVAIFWAKAVYVGVTLIPTSMYFFSVSWAGLLREKKKSVIFVYLLGLVFVILFLLTDKFVVGVYHHFYGYFSKLGAFGFLYLLFFFGVSCAFFWNLVRGYRIETSLAKRMHIRRVLIAFSVGFTIGSTEFLPTYGFEFYPMGFIAVFLLASVVAHAIIRYKLMEIETVIHKTIAWFFTSIALVVPLAVLFYFTRDWYAQLNSWIAWGYFSAIFLCFLLFVKTFHPRIDHFFQRGRHNLENALNKFSDELVHLKSLEELINKITDTIIDIVYASKVTILLYNDRLKKLVTVGSIRDSLKINLQMDPENPFLKWLSKNNRMLNQEFVELDPHCESIRQEAKEYFQIMDVVVCVPLVLNETLIGLINLGKKMNLKQYSSFDLQFLTHLKNQSTIAISNSLVYDRVEELVKIRTEELVQTQKQLIQAEKLATVGTLAGGVAHEINNPLAAILTNAQMMLMEAKNEDEKDSLRLIEDAAKRCRSIVQKLMVYSRKPLGGREVKGIDLEKALNNVISFLNYQLTQDNIKLNTKLENPPFMINGSQNEIEQVFTNLILNAKDAIKHTKNSGQIDISMARLSNKVIVKVKDSGIGIPKEHILKIFDPFFTTKDIGKGTGLGLSICQSIVHEHNGVIIAESPNNQGAIFTVTFPAVFEQQAH